MQPDLWENHADWWQREFTEGADPEYTEQILPLAARVAGRAPRACSRSGRGEGQVAATSWPPTACERGRASIRPPNQIGEAARRGRWARATCGPARRRCRSPDGSFDAVVACLVFEHIDDVDAGHRRGRPGCCAPGGRFVFFLNHPLLQTPGSGWIDDQILDPPEQYWRIGPYLAEDVDDGGGGEGRVHPVRAPPAEALRQRAWPTTASCSSGCSSRRRRPASSPGPPSTPTRPRSLVCSLLRHPPELSLRSGVHGPGRPTDAR